MIRFLAALALIITLLFSSCAQQDEGAKKAPPIDVKIITIAPKTISSNYEYVGVSESSHPVEIRARVEGYLEKIGYQEGSFIQQGELLFQLDKKPFEAALERAKGELAQQSAILWNAQQSAGRLKPLYEKNAASKRDLDNAVADELASEAKVLSAQAQVTEAELNLSYTTILSPISGLSGVSKFREGALITPGSHSLLTTISVVDPMWVLFSVSETDLLRLQSQILKGTVIPPMEDNYKVELTLSDGTVFPVEGQVNFASPTYDQETGTMLVRSVFPNPDGILKPGQFVRATVKGALRPNAIVVPQKAVLQGQRSMFVYLVNKENKVVERTVEPGPWHENDWIINSGLEEGDRVIVDGVNKVQAGSSVKILQSKNPEKSE